MPGTKGLGLERLAEVLGQAKGLGLERLAEVLGQAKGLGLERLAEVLGQAMGLGLERLAEVLGLLGHDEVQQIEHTLSPFGYAVCWLLVEASNCCLRSSHVGTKKLGGFVIVISGLVSINWVW